MKYINEILTAVSVITLLGAVSCNKEKAVETAGSAIRFGVSTSYENTPETKTTYTGENPDGTPITSSSTIERIDWESTDKIRIGCYHDTSVGSSDEEFEYADYQIVLSDNGTDKTHAGLSPVDGNGLQWGEGGHDFIALYPSPAQLSGDHADATALYEDAVAGIIPATQTATLIEGNVFKPDMNYAYMYAIASGVAKGSDVQLNFKPLVTTLAFKLLTKEDDQITSKLTSVKLSSTQSNAYLTGYFCANIDKVEGFQSLDPENGVNGEGNEITINLPDGGVQLNTTEAYTVTFLMLPMDQTNLTLTLNFKNDDNTEFKRTLELKDNGSWITVPACKKTYIWNLDAPKTVATVTITKTSGNNDVSSAAYGTNNICLTATFNGGIAADVKSWTWSGTANVLSLTTSSTEADSDTSTATYIGGSSTGDGTITATVTLDDGTTIVGTYDSTVKNCALAITGQEEIGNNNSDQERTLTATVQGGTASGNYTWESNATSSVSTANTTAGTNVLSAGSTAGEATITATVSTSNGATLSTSKSVTLRKLSITGADNATKVKVDKTLELTASLTGGTASGSAEWESGSTSYVTVSPASASFSGLNATTTATGKAKGTSKITATASTGGGAKCSAEFNLECYSSNPDYTVAGEYTVNSSNKKVYFATGNLNISTWNKQTIYSFADTFQLPRSDPYYYHEYLYSWNEVSALNLTSSTNTVVIPSSGGTMGWYVLSNDEWEYLLDERNQEYRYAECKVTNSSSSPINGLLLFPDDFSFPAGITAPTTVNARAVFDQKTYTNAEWQKLNEAGCVFLSGAGYYSTGADYAFGEYGYYWTGTQRDSSIAWYLKFIGSSTVSVGSSDKSDFYSVRLVHD